MSSEMKEDVKKDLGGGRVLTVWTERPNLSSARAQGKNFTGEVGGRSLSSRSSSGNNLVRGRSGAGLP